MSITEGPARFGHIDFNSPIAPWRADRLVAALAAESPGSILDLGCGWGELLLRVAEASPGATAVGVDTDEVLLDRGRTRARERGLHERVRFVQERADAWQEPADVVVCVGASHAFEDGAGMSALASLVRPGGWLLYGDMFWEREPTEAELERLWPGTGREDLSSLSALVEAGVDTGLRPVAVEAVERSEWDDFESGFLADKERWLLSNPGHERAGAVAEEADAHRRWWLAGHRGLVGFAYVRFGRPVV